MLLQQHVKEPSHFAKSADGWLHLNTHTPLTQQSWSELCHCPGLVWEPIWKQLTQNLSGDIQPQSSQLAEALWTDPDIKSGISVCELISTLKKKKKSQRQGMVKHSPKILVSEEKATTTHHHTTAVGHKSVKDMFQLLQTPGAWGMCRTPPDSTS